MLSGFSSFVRDVERVDKQKQQQHIGIAVVILPGDLFDHTPQTIVLNDRVHLIGIPQPNADDHVEVHLDSQPIESATLVCLRLFGKRRPL